MWKLWPYSLCSCWNNLIHLQNWTYTPQHHQIDSVSFKRSTLLFQKILVFSELGPSSGNHKIKTKLVLNWNSFQAFFSNKCRNKPNHPTEKCSIFHCLSQTSWLHSTFSCYKYFIYIANKDNELQQDLRTGRVFRELGMHILIQHRQSSREQWRGIHPWHLQTLPWNLTPGQLWLQLQNHSGIGNQKNKVYSKKK